MFLHQSAAENMSSEDRVPVTLTYDTENSYDVNRLVRFIKRYPYLNRANYAVSKFWIIIRKSQMMAEKWWDVAQKWLLEIIKSKDVVETPLVDPVNGGPLKIIYPSFMPIDSMSAFETTTTKKKMEKSDLGDDAMRMYYMNMGFDKSIVLGSLGSLTQLSGTYCTIATHLGTENAISKGRFDRPKKEFTDMKAGVTIKGVPKIYSYLVLHIWETDTNKVLYASDGKSIKYPRKREFAGELAGDLVSTMTKLVRSKTSLSGHKQNIIYSQADGIQPHLTQIVRLQDDYNWYGILANGNKTSYALELYPEVKLMRTTLREKIDTDKKLRRAIDITIEMCCTFAQFLYHESDLMCTPAQLRTELEEKGYDWDKILESRGYWTINDSKHPLPRCTTYDLLEMRVGRLELDFLKKANAKEKKK